MEHEVRNTFLEFTNYYGDPLWIRKDLIESFTKLNNSTKLNTVGNSYNVRETPEGIIKMLKGEE